MTRISFALVGFLALGTACGPAESVEQPDSVGTQRAALTVRTSDVIAQIQQATAQLAAANRQLNELVAGAYSAWPSREEFQRTSSVRGFKNDLVALNAVTLVAGAYLAGSYISPILELEDRQYVAGAYSSKLSDKVQREYAE